MDLLLQLVRNGVVLGLLYALFAYGMSLIVATSGVLHFAHGLTLVVSAYVFWFTFEAVGLPVLVAVPLGLAGGVVIGVLVELVVYRPLRRRRAGDMVLLVASLAVLTLGQSAIVFGFGTDPKSVRPNEFMSWTAPLGPVVVRMWDLLILGASVVAFVGLHLLQTRTAVGLSFRAVGDNPDRAGTLGIKLQGTYIWAFVVGSLVAGAPGILLAVQNPITPVMGFDLLVKAVVVLVIGGVGNMPGALLAGVTIGLVESLAAYRLPTEWAEFTLYLLLFVFVIARPNGLRTGRLRTA